MLRGHSLHSDGSLWAFPFPFVAVSHTGCSKSQLGFFLRVFNSSHTCVSFIFFPYSKLPTFKGVCAFKIFPNSSFLLASLSTPTPMLNPPVSSHQALVYIKQTLKLFLFQHFTEAFTFKIKALNPMNISCRTCLSSHLSDRWNKQEETCNKLTKYKPDTTYEEGQAYDCRMSENVLEDLKFSFCFTFLNLFSQCCSVPSFPANVRLLSESVSTSCVPS